MAADPLAERVVLVTGGAGRIGLRLIRELLNQRARVIVVDRTIRKPLPSGVASVEGDFANPDILKGVSGIGKIDTVIHLAARMSDEPSTSPKALDDVESELLGLVRFLKWLPQLRVFCFASSIMVYGSSRLDTIDESHPTEPANAYGVVKLAAEKLLQVFSTQTGTPVSILRLAGVYGLEVTGNRAIPAFMRAALSGRRPVIHGDGSVKRDYVFVDDVVQAILLACSTCLNGVLNIGSGEPTSVAELARIVIRLSGHPALEPEFKAAGGPLTGAASMVYNVSKAKTLIGYEPTVSLEEGLRRWMPEFAENLQQGS